MKAPQIALIGTEGSGKTVLATVLAKKFQKKQGGVWLDPIGAQTMKHLAHSWEELCNGRWLPSTPPGKLFELKWKMRVGDRECELKMIDSAGQDLRRLFSEEEYNAEDMSDQDRLFMDYIHHSTILLILINLRDFIGNANKDQVIENQAVLKGALGNLRKSNPDRQIAFVFPAYDLYEETIKSRYEGSIEKFLEDELPFLYNANVSDKNVKCFPVAAVAETEIKTDNEGRTMRVPAPNFSSKNMEPLVAWLAAAVVNGIKEDEPPVITDEPKPPTEPNDAIKAFFALVAIGVFIFFFVRGCGEPPPPPPPKQPTPCSSCGGSGQISVICTSCGGDGWQGLLGDKGWDITDGGTVSCNQCQQTGRIEKMCTTCFGTGRGMNFNK